MDSSGNEIEMDQPTRLPVSGAGRICHVTLAFIDREMDPLRGFSDSPGAESLAESRVEEDGELALAPADPAIAHPAVRRSDPCGRPHPIAIARLVRLAPPSGLAPFLPPR